MGGPCVFSFLSKGAHSVWDRRGKTSQIFFFSSNGTHGEVLPGIFVFSSRLVGAPPLGSTESPDSSANSVVGLFQRSKRRDLNVVRISIATSYVVCIYIFV